MIGPTVPTSLGEVTPFWLTQALNAEGVLGNVSVTGYSAETVSDGTGFMNQLHRLQLEFDGDSRDLPQSVVVKLPSTDPHLRLVFDSLGQNLREIRFYEELAPNSLLPTPRLHYGERDPATGDTAMVLEDMSYARQGDSVAGCSIEEARNVIRQMARFHASWWNSASLDKLSWIPLKDAEADPYQELYPDAWKGLRAASGDGLPPGLHAIGDRLHSEVPRIKAMLTEPPRTIVHGDFRLDNCFFPASDGQSPPVVFDWEFCVQGRGAFDLATFIAEVFPPAQRRAEEMELLRLYHAVLEENGVRDYPIKACIRDYRLSILEIFVFWVVAGGYCSFAGERATRYLHNMLARFDIAIAELDCMELLAE